MQSLLRVIYENLHSATSSQTSQLLYSTVKLRLPEDHLISALTERTEQLLPEMNPKDLAVSIWSLARLEYPCSKELKDQLCYLILEVLREIREEPYLYESSELSEKAS